MPILTENTDDNGSLAKGRVPSESVETPFQGLQLGCLVKPLAEQLARFHFDADVMNHFQRDMEAVSRVHVRSIIPYSAAMKAYDKLSKKIVSHVETQTALERKRSTAQAQQVTHD